MLSGTCPKCGARFFGRSLLNPENQTCYLCGTELNIVGGDDEVSSDKVKRPSVNKKKHRST